MKSLVDYLVVMGGVCLFTIPMWFWYMLLLIGVLGAAYNARIVLYATVGPYTWIYLVASVLAAAWSTWVVFLSFLRWG